MRPDRSPRRGGLDCRDALSPNPGGQVSAAPAVFAIHSNGGGGRVEVEGNRVRLWRREVQPNVLVDEHEKGQTIRAIATLFKSLADDWRGWDGRLGWESIEGEFKLYATHDGLGTVEMEITLAQRITNPGQTWSASATLLLDAGGLADIAREAVKLAD